ncbi:hypothetical protein ABB29_09645 [Pseudoxanthomonas dokdonensis]|uniref:DUF4124 domain-containing protein n=2 Tax=Pseudoxanthomonas dokdonensis TaxID=344882 RepID=A0A0R0CIR2_9GAMM|nr:hypothetical protein ABB29_09645 [Pseudoxanthomonas dokdonensis]
MTLARMLLPCLLCLSAQAVAEDVVFYRCTDASGALTLQNMPCPKGAREEKRVMEGVMTVPMASTPSAPAAPATVAAASPDPVPPAAAASAPTTPAQPALPAIADADRLPPPLLYQCTTYDRDSYLSEDGEPASRCVPLQTVGLDGNPQGGAGQACEVRRDTCARVPDGALCDAWKKRRDETEVAWRFARPEHKQKNQEEFDRVNRIVTLSTCGMAAPATP